MQQGPLTNKTGASVDSSALDAPPRPRSAVTRVLFWLAVVSVGIAVLPYTPWGHYMPADLSSASLSESANAAIRDISAAAKPKGEQKATAVPGKGGGRPPVGVGVVVIQTSDVPVYLTGLGSVAASLTIAIHSQVDGKLEKVLFTEGQHVKKGDVLAEIDPRLFKAAFDLARAKREQDKALLIAAEKDMERFRELAAKNFQSQQSIDQQKAKVDQLKATISADEATIETAQTQLDYTKVVAPANGRIGVRLVDPGNLVRASDAGAIATLVETQPSSVLFTLPAQALTSVRQALSRGVVEVAALDQNNRHELAKGKLLLIDNAIDQATATIRLKAMFPNSDDALWPGQFVNARLLVETRKDAISVPVAALQRGPKGQFVWVVGPDNTAQPHYVELGPANAETVIVASGVAVGDRVVVDGQYKLEVGAKVQISPTAAGQPSDKPENKPEDKAEKRS